MLATLSEPAVTRPLLATRFNELYGTISPDGRSIAYLSDESGTLELYVRAFPSMTAQVRVSTNGAFSLSNSGGVGRPVWRHDGRELIYVAADGPTILSVDVRPGTAPEFGTAHPLFTLPPGTQDIVAAPDFDRFLLSLERRQTGPLGVTVLINWAALLEPPK
jgi:WD40-like Beta Propeller Repeat